MFKMYNEGTVMIILLLFLCLSCPLFADRTVVDEIRCIVYTPDGPRIKLSSDVKPNLDGRPRTLREVVCEELMVCEAERYHITVTPEDVERYMDELRKNNNMTRFGMEKVMEEMNYSYVEGLEQLQRRQMTEQLLDGRVRSDKRFMIPRTEAAAFDDEHPLFEEGVYTLAEVLVADPAALKKDFSAAELKALPWEEPFEVKESDLAESMRFVTDAPVGNIVVREAVAGGVELTRLVAKKPRRRVGLEDVVDPRTKKTLYDKIVEVMRMQRYEKILKEYQDELLQKSAIRFTHPQDKIFVLEGKD